MIKTEILSLIKISSFCLIFLIGCTTKDPTETIKKQEVLNMKLTSNAFKNHEKIPSKYTCDGDNINPELIISDVPKDTKSFVLIVDDPDVPEEVRAEQMWTHWVVFNIPKETRIIKENSQPGISGKSDYPFTKYGGPCPPKQFQPARHRYFFKLYALDIKLDLTENAAKEKIEQAMKDHILAKAELIGTYERP